MNFLLQECPHAKRRSVIRTQNALKINLERQNADAGLDSGETAFSAHQKTQVRLIKATDL